MSVTRKQRLVRLAGGLLLAACVAAVWINPGVLPSREILSRTWSWSLAPLAALGMLAMALSVALRGARWVLLVADQRAGDARTLMAGYAWYTLLLQLLPLRAGDAAKVLWMKLLGGSAVASTVALVAERSMDAVCLVLVTSAAVLLDARVAALLGPGAPALLAALAALALGGALAALAYLGMPRRVLLCLAFSVLAWAAVVACYSVLLGATVGAPLSAALAVVAMATLANLFLITPAGIGLFEAAGTIVLAAFFVAADSALAAVTLLHAVVLAGLALPGVAGRLYLARVERNAGPEIGKN
jgi:uncharacterized membrane protein YbhN (UPF0104 family)